MTQPNTAKRWRASRNGPWPWVHTNGELGRAEVEWLHTNGAGAYSMSTAALMHTRRYHGVLVAALDPPLGRHVMLSHAEVSVRAGGTNYRLATHQFPNVAPTPGYRLLRRFTQQPVPTWTYQLGHRELEMSICLARGQNTVILRLIWLGRRPVEATIRPLMPLRPIHSLTREFGGMIQSAALRPGEVKVRPVPHLPAVVFRHEGVFVGSPDWWRRFEYLEDRTRAAEFQEDMWTPGTFELTLEPDSAHHLLATTDAPAEASPGELFDQTIATLMTRDPGPNRRSSIRSLSLAADAFCAVDCPRPAVIAGYPWYGVHLRDVTLSLPGVCLARGETVAAKKILRTVVDSMRGGWLPELLAEPGHQRAAPSPEATLWLFEVARELIERVGLGDEFVSGPLYRTLRRAYVRLSRGPRRWAWRTEDGLIANGVPNRPLTWMDAHVGDRPITPRSGCAIEWQSLWTSACATLARLAQSRDQADLASDCRSAAERARSAFKARFWCHERNYPYDCVSEPAEGEAAWRDSSIRPNAVVALALDKDLFEPWQATAIIDRARLDLVTPRGLRSLSPSDSRYQGYHEGGLEQREGSSHQGSAWPHLLGFYVRACLATAPEDALLRDELRELAENAIDGGPVLGHVAKLCDGDIPHNPRGCPAQAWGAAELLRALVCDLKV
ncbi:MAG: glycogen debranching enzyme family protein [Polyangiaceae bacterium]|nr:glycogen debranching enzyme family protein [Polyangiaceae bacterium]